MVRTFAFLIFRLRAISMLRLGYVFWLTTILYEKTDAKCAERFHGFSTVKSSSNRTNHPDL